MSSSDRTPDELDVVIGEYLEALREGRAPSRHELLERYPELAPRLEEFLANYENFGEMCHGARSALTLQPGMRIGDYEVLEEIERGGMGVVFKARQSSLNRIVALKVILAGRLASETDVLRFRREAEAAAALDHPHIVSIYEISEEDGLHYFSMQYVDGEPLSRSDLRGAGDARRTAELVETIGRAVQYAHDRGVLHRDLKPSNVLVDGRGWPYVLDFGLAKILTCDRSLTVSGAMVGTPKYMAPEQTKSTEDCDTPATDVYSLGALLYELLTGRPPFDGSTSLEILDRVRWRDPVRPRLLRPGLPIDLETICLRCLEKEPRRRYPSVGELATDLRRFERGEPIAARPVGPLKRAHKWVRRRPAVAALLTLLALVIVGIPAMALRWNFELRESEARMRRFFHAAYLNLSLAAWEDGLPRRARELHSNLRPHDGEGDLRGFGWYHLNRRLNPERLCLKGHEAIVQSVQFDPEGHWILSGSADGEFRLWDAESGSLLAVLPPPTAASKLGTHRQAVSPDGGLVAQNLYDETTGATTIRVAKVEKAPGGYRLLEHRRLALPEGWPGHRTVVAFSSDGQTLAAASLQVVTWETTTWKRRGCTESLPSKIYQIAYSPAGDVLATADVTGKVVIRDAVNLKRIQTLEEVDRSGACVVFSPSGELLAKVGAGGQVELWDTASWTRTATLEVDRERLTALVFAPDGKTLAVVGTVPYPAVQLWDVATAIRQRVLRTCQRVLRGLEALPIAAAFSPDGTALAAGGYDQTLRVWDLGTHKEPLRLELPGETYYGITLRSDGQAAVLRRRDFTLELLELEQQGSSGAGVNPICRGTIAWPGGSPSVAALAPGGGHAACVFDDASIVIYDLDWNEAPPAVREAARLRTEADGADCEFTALEFSPDAGGLLAATSKGEVALFERADDAWPERRRLHTGIDDVSDLALSPDGTLLAVARYRRGSVTLWDLREGRELAPLEAHTDWVIVLRFDPHSKRLVTAGLDRTVCLWDTDALRRTSKVAGRSATRPLQVLTGHDNAVTAAVFLADGNGLATTSDDGTIKLWDLVASVERLTLKGHRHHVNGLALSPGGDVLISVGGHLREFGEVILWLTGDAGAR